MRNWNQDSLDSICNIVKGEQLNKLDLEKSGDYPCINGGIDPSGYTNKWNRFENTITISEGGNSCGYVNFLKVKFWSGGHCYSLQNIKEGFDLDFLYYALKGNESKIMGLRVGSGLPNIQQKAIKAYEIKYPEDKPEQTRIAEILSTADEAIAHTEALIAKYQRIKNGLMQDLLTNGIDENGNIRNKQTHKFVVKNGIEVPEEWKVKQIIKTTYLKARIGWQGLKASEFIIEGPFLVTGTDFRNGIINWKSCYHVTEERYQEAKYIQLKENDLLITKDGTIGKTALVKNCPDKAVLNSGVFVLRCKDNSYNNEFMYYILNSKYFEDFLFKTQGGSTINHLYQREFEKFYFPCPENREQCKIINILNQSVEIIVEEELKLKKHRSLKTGLMQDLLSGKLRVNMKNKNLKRYGKKN